MIICLVVWLVSNNTKETTKEKEPVEEVQMIILLVIWLVGINKKRNNQNERSHGGGANNHLFGSLVGQQQF